MTRSRWRRLIIGQVLGLAAVLTAAGCTAGPAGPASAGPSARPAAPAITPAQARQVFDSYVSATAEAVRTSDGRLALSVVTGVQRAVLAATLGSHSVVVHPASATAAYRSSLTVKPSYGQDAYGTPVFYLPEAAGYPRFFVADVTQTAEGAASGDGTTAAAGGAALPADGPVLMLFEQASATAPWLLGSISRLPTGTTLPKMATDSAGYIPVVLPSAGTLLASPDLVGPLQAAVVDDGPASTATRAVADGPLTTGLYEGAVNHASGLRPPGGDVYQWELEGSDLPQFALRTADGGALAFYSMSLTTTVAVPDFINKADPVNSGPPIQVPVNLQMLLPAGHPAPLIQLSSEQTLSFAAIDPPPSPAARIQVIAMGGGLTSASAS